MHIADVSIALRRYGKSVSLTIRYRLGRKNMKTLEEITDYYGPQLAKAAFELGAIKLSPDLIHLPGFRDIECLYTMTIGSSWQSRVTGL